MWRLSSIRKCLILFLTLAASPSVASDAADRDVEALAKLIVSNLLSREYMLYGDEALHYAEAATAVGALRFAAATDDMAMLQRLTARYAALIRDDSPLISRRPHVDMNVIGIVPLQIAMTSTNPAYLRVGLSLADSQWDEPLENGLTNQSRWWIDDLYMVGMLQMQAFRATGEMRYADHAARQLAAYIPKLQRANGLFYHSTDVPIFWGRGNGWVAVAMAEVLSSLPDEHELRDLLLQRYQLMMQSLLRFQSGEGMWRQVIDYEPSWVESSATAMFAFAMLVGIQKGLLPHEHYQEAVDRAWTALAQRVDSSGNLADVCIGTGKLNDLDYYLARPTVSGDYHGQAPMLWLATALLNRTPAAD